MNTKSNRDGVPETRHGSDTRLTAMVSFGPFGRPTLCDARNLNLQAGDKVMVEDRRTMAFATVLRPSMRRSWPSGLGAMPTIARIATDADHQAQASAKSRQEEALSFVRGRARALQLDIKVFRVVMNGPIGRDSKVTVFFAAEHRVDFRDLVKELASHFKARVELRQVGVRDEAKMVGGIGTCGQELCCSRFLPRFEPVSIKMAKNQNLALTPSKISGQCGRLKCCLVYEDATYVEAAKHLPKVGKNGRDGGWRGQGRGRRRSPWATARQYS